MVARCKACSAPLPPKSTVCTYCGARNDIDLRGIHDYSVTYPESDRFCPECEIEMQTIDLSVDKHFYIEQCPDCMGLFFDLNELEMLLDASVDNVFNVDFKRLEMIKKENVGTRLKVKYNKCPVCRKFMHRNNYGAASGVILDTCRDHGVWLQGGELRRLFEWKKAGGSILAEKRKEMKKEEEKKRKKGGWEPQSVVGVESHTGSHESSPYLSSSSGDVDIIETVMDMIFKLFH